MFIYVRYIFSPPQKTCLSSTHKILVRPLRSAIRIGKYRLFEPRSSKSAMEFQSVHCDQPSAVCICYVTALWVRHRGADPRGSSTQCVWEEGESHLPSCHLLIGKGNGCVLSCWLKPPGVQRKSETGIVCVLHWWRTGRCTCLSYE